MFSPWFIVVRNGSYTESLTLYDYVYVFGEKPAGATIDQQVIISRSGTTSHTFAGAGGWSILGNLQFLEFGDVLTNPLFAFSGTGEVNFINTNVMVMGGGTTQALVDSNGVGVDISHGSWENAGTGDLANVYGGAVKFVARYSNLDVNEGKLVVDSDQSGAECELLFSTLLKKQPTGGDFIQTWRQLYIRHCDIDCESNGFAIAVNPTAATYTNAELEITNSKIYGTNGGVEFTTTGVSNANFNVGSSVISSTSFVGGTPLEGALGYAPGVAYDNTTSGLSAGNVQAAIDELASGFNYVETSAAVFNVSNEDMVLVQSSVGGTITVSLPNAAGFNGALIVKGDSGTAASNVTISPQGGETIEGAASYTISTNDGSVTLVSDENSNWHVVATV